MKQNNNNNRRARGRGPRKPHGMGGGHNKGQSYDGGGQELRVRGNAYQVLEKYLQLARDAGAAGDRVAAENFLQHADHYYRVLSSMNEGQRPRMGGRELSVADVNVQNVSQGLSAALYTSGGPNPQGIADADLDMSGQGNGNRQGNQGGDQQGGSQQQGNPQHQQGGQQHGGHQQHGRHEQRGDRHGNQGNERRGNDRQGNDRQGNDRQGGDRQGGQQADGNVAASNGHGNYEAYERPVAAAAPHAQPVEPVRAAPVAAPSEDQPDYPEELLNQPAAAPAAEPAVEADEGVQRTLRAPRSRLRGPGRRGPRQTGGQGAQAGGGQGGTGEGQGPSEPSE